MFIVTADEVWNFRPLYDLFVKIFSNRPSETPVGTISWFHLGAIILAILIPIALYFIFRNKSEEARVKFIRIISTVLPILYAFDFFLQPFYAGGMTTEKLPFHICTLMAILIPLVTFNKKLSKFNDVIACWCILAAVVYIIYPGTWLEEQYCMWYSYSIIQPFLYHIVILSWGIFMIMFGQAKMNYKKFYRAVIFMFIVAAWAEFGNLANPGLNWFFLHTDPAWFGLGFLPFWLFLIAMGGVMSLCIFIIYFITDKLYNYSSKHKKRIAD